MTFMKRFQMPAAPAGLSKATRSSIVKVIGVMLLPVLLAYAETVRTGYTTVREEAARVADFLLAEAEGALSETEHMMDDYLHRTNGSCRGADLRRLAEFIATSNAVEAMGVVAPDGKIACQVGRLDLDGLVFPEASDARDSQPQFAELRIKRRSVPVLVKRGRSDRRAFSVMSTKHFNNILMPEFIIDYAQIDVVLPRGGLWYTLTGNAISGGFSDSTFVLDKPSSRFPISLTLVLDNTAARQWGGELRRSLVIIVGISLAILATIWGVTVIIKRYRRSLQQRLERRMAANARDMFEIKYQPMINLESGLLIGAIVKYDLSIFDHIPDYSPKCEEILAQAWEQIGPFARKRRRFYLVMPLDAKTVVDDARRDKLVQCLKEIDYENIIFELRWPEGKQADPKLYKPLEQLATAGSMLAIDCASVRFSLMSEMWSWPYHRLVCNFESLPRTEDGLVWSTEIVIDMGEQLQIPTIATGLYDVTAVEIASRTGFACGAGDEIGPALPIDVFLSVTRPVQRDGEDGADGSAQRAA
ncbi:MAG: hypothetical protein AAGE89_13040 [Pseudomonadota bacterium]